MATKKTAPKAKRTIKAAPIRPVAPARGTVVPSTLPHHAIHYRGNVPLKSFLGWLVLVVLAVASVGGLAAQLLVGMRQSQLIEDTAAVRVVNLDDRVIDVVEFQPQCPGHDRVHHVQGGGVSEFKNLGVGEYVP